jgi:Domain of unknown function (DUF4157)
MNSSVERHLQPSAVCSPTPLKRGCRDGPVADDNDIYFRPGVYNASTTEGIALLGHELVHVGQYRNGMTTLSYLLSTRVMVT